MISHQLLDEPELEFGDGGKHVDPRLGLLNNGPLMPALGEKIKIGVIGTSQTVDGFASWLERARTGFPSKTAKQPNLFPPFPGLENNNPFRAKFEVLNSATRSLPARDIGDLVAIAKHSDAVRESSTLFTEQATAILEGSDKPDVIVAALPFELIMKVVNEIVEAPTDEDSDDGGEQVDFRDLLKAQTLHLHRPTQIVWPTLWDDNARIPRKLKATLRKVQDPATRAWNLLNALYYKAGRAPWRLPRPEDQHKATYVGIGFYRDLSGQRLLTSTAQMFDERGRGLILRGGRARVDKGDLHPYLGREDAYELLLKSLKSYYAQHHHYPARVVVMKTSRFEEGEVDGFQQALKEANIGFRDLIWVSESSPITMFREGDYPPLRGSMVDLGMGTLLFTRGSVPVYRTYPGLRVPVPLFLRPHSIDSRMSDVAKDVLALTKMNWNSTQFDGALPIPIRAARQVGKVLKHVPIGQREATDYSYYM